MSEVLKKIKDYRLIRVLIVDDSETVRRSIIGILELEDSIEIIGEAINGNEAVDFSANLHPDVILMDLVMPKMNGLEATRIINKNNPEIKIIALSGLFSDNKKKEMLKAGASFFFSKQDLQMEELIKEINSPKITS